MAQGVELSSLALLSSTVEDGESLENIAVSGRRLLKRQFLRRIKHYLPQIQQAAVELADVALGENSKPYWCGTIPPNVLSPFMLLQLGSFSV